MDDDGFMAEDSVNGSMGAEGDVDQETYGKRNLSGVRPFFSLTKASPLFVRLSVWPNGPAEAGRELRERTVAPQPKFQIRATLRRISDGRCLFRRSVARLLVRLCGRVDRVRRQLRSRL